MASETITRNDLKAILDEVLPPKRNILEQMTVSGTTSSTGALSAIISGIFVWGKCTTTGYEYTVVVNRGDGYISLRQPLADGMTPVANANVTVTIYYIPAGLV